MTNKLTYADIIKLDAEQLLRRYREGLESIARNSCCDSCQEAKLVALHTLEITETKLQTILGE